MQQMEIDEEIAEDLQTDEGETEQDTAEESKCVRLYVKRANKTKLEGFAKSFASNAAVNNKKRSAASYIDHTLTSKIADFYFFDN